MVIRATRFNTYLLLLIMPALVPGAGCRSPEGKREKQVSTLRVHLEVNATGTVESEKVPVYRARPVMVNIEKQPFLTEGNLASANVVEALGGFALQIQFNQQGTRLLEQYSSTAPGKHFAIFSQFGGTNVQSRWIAAPLIGKRISDGMLLFTPDATRDEADEIAIGLNNVASKNQPSKKK